MYLFYFLISILKLSKNNNPYDEQYKQSKKISSFNDNPNTIKIILTNKIYRYNKTT